VETHADEVRNEGLYIKKENDKRVDLEIEAPGSATEVAADGAKTIQNTGEFEELNKSLTSARKRPENKIGNGGFEIPLKDPKEFVNSMNVIVMQDPKTSTDNIMLKKFDTKNSQEASQASQVMAAVLTSEMGATIVDD